MSWTVAMGEPTDPGANCTAAVSFGGFVPTAVVVVCVLVTVHAVLAALPTAVEV